MLLTDLEIAIKFNVPTVETSIVLDWQNETYYWWVFSELSDNIRTLCYYDRWKEVFYSATTFEFIALLDKNPKRYRAPQMHEIAQKLPKLVYGDEEQDAGDTIPINMLVGEHGYVEYYEVDLYATWENYHFAEAFARLYIDTIKRHPECGQQSES